MTKIYLDTCIFVADYSGLETDRTHKTNIASAFNVFSNLKNIELLTSMWSMTELVRVLTNTIHMDAAKVAEIEQGLLNERRFHGLKFKFVDVSPDSTYDFGEFFYNIRRGVLTNKSGVPDTIHAVIMKNNDIDHILTTDIDGFRDIPGLKVLHPKDVKLF